MPGQVVSPYAPAYSGMVTPCGGVMPSAHVPGTVMFGSQFPQYQPSAQYGSYPQMMQYGQSSMQYGQPTVMPVAGSVAGGVMTQPYQTGQLQLSGTNFNGMTYQPSQQGMVYPSGMTYQPGMVYQAGAMGTYSNQPVMLSGYAPSYGYAQAPAYAPGGGWLRLRRRLRLRPAWLQPRRPRRAEVRAGRAAWHGLWRVRPEALTDNGHSALRGRRV